MTLSLLPLSSVQAQDNKASLLAELSIEELANIQITSAARHPEFLGDASAAIFVITSDSIRRSGAATLPEALRLAPNLQVARLDASQYAISARGFNNAIGNKLLVLIDGRTVYTPFFSGVFWDQQDVMLEDVDRIEVISGPGATLWGANAVNGVINVITKSSAHTQGGTFGGWRGQSGAGSVFQIRWRAGRGRYFSRLCKGGCDAPGCVDREHSSHGWPFAWATGVEG
ncbi:TonB-dependent receptor plug domain-containing protein [Acidovorax radicis]|uniref:TonB-dependent receptor plug domain-containing protein n=1 Tax=Acidovorax radicis TaxID=758826 RepID=UPI00131ED490|nr:TonB-dependent receptor plug domain-containing protein [Acidovorax radicis]